MRWFTTKNLNLNEIKFTICSRQLPFWKSLKFIAIRIQYNQSMFKEDRANFLKIFQQIPNNSPFSPQLQKKQNNFIKAMNQLEVSKFGKSPKQTLNYIAVPKHSLFDIFDVYEWRSKTQYPIVWAKWNGVVINKSQIIIKNRFDVKFKQIIQKDQSIQDKILIQVVHQQVQPLLNYGALTFSSFAYALKESLIGFQRLFALFGEFSVKPQMITVNKEGKIKVWLSNHYYQNTKNQLNFISNSGKEGFEKIILYQIKQTFLLFSQNNTTYRDFFTFIENIDTFIGFLRFIEQYISFRKILVSQTIQKRNQRSQKRPFSPVIKIKQVPRTPNFISPQKNSLEKRDQKNDHRSSKSIKQKQYFKVKYNFLDKFDTNDSLPTKSELLQKIPYINQAQIEDFANRRSHKVKPTHLNNCKNSGIQTQTSLQEQKKQCLKAKKIENQDNKLTGTPQNTNSLPIQDIFGKGPFFNLGSFGKSIRKSRYIQMEDLH